MAGVIVWVARVPVRRDAVGVVRAVNVTNGVVAGPGLVPGHSPRMVFRGNATRVVTPLNPQIHCLRAQVGPDVRDRTVCRIIWR